MCLISETQSIRSHEYANLLFFGYNKCELLWVCKNMLNHFNKFYSYFKIFNYWFGLALGLVGQIVGKKGCDASKETREECKPHLCCLRWNFLKLISMIVLECDIS